MAAKEFDIFKNIDMLEKSISRLFEGASGLSRPSFAPERAWNPPLDVIETPGEFIVIMEIAGARKEDISVSLDGSLLRIKGLRRPPGDIEVTRLHQIELDFGEFERILRLPDPVNEKKITATYQDGFLRVTVPKEGRRERVIEVTGE